MATEKTFQNVLLTLEICTTVESWWWRGWRYDGDDDDDDGDDDNDDGDDCDDDGDDCDDDDEQEDDADAAD